MLSESLTARLDRLLASDDATRALRYPGTQPGRQPVHTVYVPADRYQHSTVADWGTAAIDALEEFGPLPGFDEATWAEIEPLVHAKLGTEPIEDLRIDFEDGFGIRSDVEEDAAVTAAADALMQSHADRSAPLSIGLRIKSLEGPTRARAIRTLDLFLHCLHSIPEPHRVGDSAIPESFRVTLPKVTSVLQIAAMVELCTALESEYGLAEGRLRFEIQIETPQAILGADGTVSVAKMIHAAAGRCDGLHYGTYDYSASLGIAAAFQSMEHPAADYAKQVMQVAAAATGVPVSDGSTNVLPVGDADTVRAAWELHARLVRRSLERGFYQGWDLHPAQLPTRYAATFAFYRSGLTAAVGRLNNYLSRSASGILDEPATAAALAGYLTRGLDCGAYDESAINSLIPQGLAALDRPTLDRLSGQRS